MPNSLGPISSVHGTDEAYVAHVVDLLRDLISTEQAAVAPLDLEIEGERCSLFRSGALIAAADHGASTTRSIVQFLNLTTIEANAGKVLLHASAVTRAGVTVVLSGVSGSGKTTLAAALVARGWDYLTDEVVICDPQSRAISPYPKPLSVKSGSHQVLAAHAPPSSRWPEATWQVPASTIRAGCVSWADVPTGPTHIVAPRYAEGAATELTGLSRAAAMVVLGQNSSRLPALYPLALPALDRTIGDATTVRMVFSDLDDACETIERL